MKMMSRSRYHALSWSFGRMRGHLRGTAQRTRRPRKAVAVCAVAEIRASPADDGARRSGKGSFGGLLPRAMRSIITIIRTGVVPRETDI